MLDLHPNIEGWNALVSVVHSRAKDTPAKTWWDAEALHPATFRALRIDRADFAAAYAVHPFRLARIDGKPLILAAHPAPLILGPVDDDHLNIEAVIAWNPVDNRAFVLGDETPQLVGALSDDAPTLFASPFAFFRAWLEARAAFAMLRSQLVGKDWMARPTEHGTAPGALMIGAIDAIRWNPASLPRDLVCVGADPMQINRAILRAARLPRVSNSMKAAA